MSTTMKKHPGLLLQDLIERLEVGDYGKARVAAEHLLSEHSQETVVSMSHHEQGIILKALCEELLDYDPE